MVANPGRRRNGSLDSFLQASAVLRLSTGLRDSASWLGGGVTYDRVGVPRGGDVALVGVQEPQHVVERAVLEHEHDDVLDPGELLVWHDHSSSVAPFSSIPPGSPHPSHPGRRTPARPVARRLWASCHRFVTATPRKTYTRRRETGGGPNPTSPTAMAADGSSGHRERLGGRQSAGPPPGLDRLRASRGAGRDGHARCEPAVGSGGRGPDEGLPVNGVDEVDPHRLEGAE